MSGPSIILALVMCLGLTLAGIPNASSQSVLSPAAQQLHEDHLSKLSASDAGQIKLGRDLEQRFIARVGGRYLNPALQTAVADFAQQLFLQSGRRAFPWRVTVVNNDLPSAWALPGGHVVIYKGLLRYVDTPDELALVITHEMAHAEQNHLMDIVRRPTFVARLTPSQVTTMLASFQENPIAGILAPRALGAVDNALFEIVRQGYGAELERAADDAATEIMRRSGHSPVRGATIFQTLSALAPVGATGTTSLYAGRAETEDRIEALEQTIGADDGAQPPNPGYDVIKSIFPTRRHLGFARASETASP